MLRGGGLMADDQGIGWPAAGQQTSNISKQSSYMCVAGVGILGARKKPEKTQGHEVERS